MIKQTFLFKERLIMRNIILIFLFLNFAHAQGFECDNNFGDCGTPEQSGGGGGGKGSVLIENTDLGDTYQHADDYDGDGIEDSSDNCMRDYNPQQLDSDADTHGDMCDNCVGKWNLYQDDSDGDGVGDACDEDIDDDGILNSADDCPYHWGNSYCLEELNLQQYRITEDIANDNDQQRNIPFEEPVEDIVNQYKDYDQGCATYKNRNIDLLFAAFLLSLIAGLLFL